MLLAGLSPQAPDYEHTFRFINETLGERRFHRGRVEGGRPVDRVGNGSSDRRSPQSRRGRVIERCLKRVGGTAGPSPLVPLSGRIGKASDSVLALNAE
jgi:hypothetical protein